MFKELHCVTDEPVGSIRVKTFRKIETKRGIVVESIEDYVTKTEDTPLFDEYSAKELIENGINMNPSSTKFLDPNIDNLLTTNSNENE